MVQAQLCGSGNFRSSKNALAAPLPQSGMLLQFWMAILTQGCADVAAVEEQDRSHTLKLSNMQNPVRGVEGEEAFVAESAMGGRFCSVVLAMGNLASHAVSVKGTRGSLTSLNCTVALRKGRAMLKVSQRLWVIFFRRGSARRLA
jgi:hypothetical protein